MIFFLKLAEKSAKLQMLLFKILTYFYLFPFFIFRTQKETCFCFNFARMSMMQIKVVSRGVFPFLLSWDATRLLLLLFSKEDKYMSFFPVLKWIHLKNNETNTCQWQSKITFDTNNEQDINLAYHYDGTISSLRE